MGKVLFLEGELGVGKTEIAKLLTHHFQTDLIRLQCYEGLDINQMELRRLKGEVNRCSTLHIS